MSKYIQSIHSKFGLYQIGDPLLSSEPLAQLDNDLSSLSSEVVQQGELIAELLRIVTASTPIQMEVQDPSLEVQTLDTPSLNIV